MLKHFSERLATTLLITGKIAGLFVIYQKNLKTSDSFRKQGAGVARLSEISWFPLSPNYYIMFEHSV